MIYYPHISANWTDFANSEGYGVALSDAISCVVTEERNGSYELEMEYPYNGDSSSMLLLNAIISVIPYPGGTPEPFRIYSVTKDIKGVLLVHARHVVYDADGIVLEPFTAVSAADIASKLNNHSDPTGLPPFRVYTDGYAADTYNMTVETPTSLFACLGLAADVLGGELGYHFNSGTGYLDITIYHDRGVSSMATVSYGVNLTSMNGFTSNERVYTDVYPYYFKDGTLVKLPEKTLSTGISGRKRILSLDMTSAFKVVPTVAELRTAAQAYISTTDFDYESSTAVDFVPLDSTSEYYGTAAAQAVNLCDTLLVSAQPIGVYVRAKVVKAVCNTLLGKYISLTVGEIQQNVADTIARLDGQNTVGKSSLSVYDGGVNG